MGKHQAQVDAAVIRKSRASYSMHKKYGELAPTKEQESAKSGKTEEAFDKAMMDVAQELSDSGYAVELKDKTTGETLADFSANMPEYAVVAVPKEALTEIPQQYIDAGYSPARYKSVAMEAVLNALSDDSYELHSHLVIDGDVFFIGRQKNENNS